MQNTIHYNNAERRTKSLGVPLLMVLTAWKPMFEHERLDSSQAINTISSGNKIL